MKKKLSLLLSIVLCIGVLGACSPKANNESANKPVENQEATGKDPEQQTDVAFQDKGYKVAYVLNSASSDIFKMALDAAIAEGKKLGIQVDVYTSDGDDLRFQDLLNQCAEQGYDGLYISHAKTDYAYDFVKTFTDRGIKVVTFDTVVADPSGNTIPGVTSVFQDDYAMARLSLDYLLDVVCKDAPRPIKLLKLWRGPGIPPFDRRQEVYKEYEDAGKIQTLELLGPSNLSDSEGSMNQVTASVLPKYPEGSVDAIWSAFDAYARGSYKALVEANRTDIPVVSIDISNQDINLMLEDDGIWKACVAVHFDNVGIQGIRLLAQKLHGDETESVYNLPPSIVTADLLNEGANVTNLGDMIEGYGINEDNIADWMLEITGKQ